VPDAVEIIEAEPITPLVARGLPESSLGDLPAVRVYRASDGSGMEYGFEVYARRPQSGTRGEQ
jgi:hypothetical protein